MKKNKKDIFENRIQRWISTFFINIGTILVFSGCGYLLDNFFETTPWFFMALLIISFPVSLTIQIYRIKKIAHYE